MRKITFYKDGFYHIYNRGVDKRELFLDDGDRRKFLSGFSYASGCVEIIAFCLMNNHFHVLVRQINDEGGVSAFMHRLGVMYTMFFNRKYQRKGRLFESTFHAVEVADAAHFLHISRYIHMNPIDLMTPSSRTRPGKVMQFLQEYPWSSFRMYAQPELIDYGIRPARIMECFLDRQEYVEFIRQWLKYYET